MRRDGNKIYPKKYYPSLARRYEQNGFWRGGKVEVICDACGVIFKRYPCRINKKGNNYCSWKCLKKNDPTRGLSKNQNQDNPMWKGDGVSYGALHAWITRHKPKPQLCELCQKNEPYDLSNKSGEYKRDITDFSWLCRKCHCVVDRKRTKVTLKCGYCHKEFSSNKGQENKTCSRECFIKYRQTGSDIKCPACGTKFYASPSLKKKYCSRRCYFYARKNKKE